MTNTEFFIMHGLCDGGEGNYVFKNRSERDEMALSLYQERLYNLFANYVQNDPGRKANLEMGCFRDKMMVTGRFHGQASAFIGTNRQIVMVDEEAPLIDGMAMYCVTASFEVGDMRPEQFIYVFNDESDRNEMALSLYQEAEYLYATHMEHYPGDYGVFYLGENETLANDCVIDYVAKYVDGEEDTIPAPNCLISIRPVIDYQDLAEALKKEYGNDFFRDTHILDLMFPYVYHNDCYLRYFFRGGEYPYIATCEEDEVNESYRRFLIDEYLMRILPADCSTVLISICW